MRYLSVCSGIEAATVAWHPLGWEAFAYSEIEPFPSAVLAHHYPQTPNFGDMTKFKDWPNDANVDVLVGGTPCQSFSVAGLRKGLDDPRGNLMLTYLAIADKYRPKWLVWENVPGVLSSNRGRDFAALLRGMAELGYGFAYRVLDAQYFGVAQRRRRVFVVACLGDWRSAAAVLFERDSLCGNPAPSREAQQEVARSAGSGLVGGVDYENNAHGADEPTGPLMKGSPTGGGHPLPAIITMAHGQGGGGRPEGAAGYMLPVVASGKNTIGTLMANAGTKLWLGNQEALSGDYHILQPAYGIPGNWIGRRPENGGNAVEPMLDVAPCQTKTDVHAVAYSFDSLSSNSMKSDNPHSGCNKVDVAKTLDTGRGLDPACNQGGMAVVQASVAVAFDGYNQTVSSDTSQTIRSEKSDGDHVGMVMQNMQVRRLTPVECERLQGFHDGYSAIPWRNKPASECPDGPRYKALGNSFAVPVVRWIGERIQLVESINLKKLSEAA